MIALLWLLYIAFIEKGTEMRNEKGQRTKISGRGTETEDAMTRRGERRDDTVSWSASQLVSWSAGGFPPWGHRWIPPWGHRPGVRPVVRRGRNNFPSAATDNPQRDSYTQATGRQRTASTAGSTPDICCSCFGRSRHRGWAGSKSGSPTRLAPAGRASPRLPAA